MRKIEEYILLKIISPFSFCFILLSSIYVIVDLSTKLDHIIKNKIAFETIIAYYFYSFPRIISEIIPLCLLVAAIYSLTKMNKYNEIVAMRSSAISYFTILKPYFAFALLLVAFAFWNQEELIPLAYQKLKNTEEIFEGRLKEKLYKNVTFYAEGNRIIFAKEFYPGERLLNTVVILEQNIDKKVLYKITAESAQYVKGKWILYNLVIAKLDPENTALQEVVALSKKEYDLTETPEELLAYDTEITYQPFKSLLKKISNFRGVSDEVVRRISVELYHKLSYPFTNIVLLLLGLFVGLKSRQASLLKGLGIALIIGFGYYTIDAFTYSLGKIGFLPPLLGASFANIFFLFFGGYLLFKVISR